MFPKLPFQILAVIYIISVLGFIFPKLKTGIIPRKTKGLIGIIFAPFFHNNWKHLISNTIPLIILLFTLQYFYPNQFIKVLSLILFCGGVLLFLIGRKSNHIGASGIIYGLISYIVIIGFISLTMKPILVSIAVLLLYGSFIWGIFPSKQKNISWEGHLCYAIAGVFAVYLIKHIL